LYLIGFRWQLFVTGATAENELVQISHSRSKLPPNAQILAFGLKILPKYIRSDLTLGILAQYLMGARTTDCSPGTNRRFLDHAFQMAIPM
jgi:hypothetical protein